jgi:hypothetical protein
MSTKCRTYVMENVVNCTYAKHKRKQNKILFPNNPDQQVASMYGTRERILKYYHKGTEHPWVIPPRRLPPIPCRSPTPVLQPGHKFLEQSDLVISVPRPMVSPGGTVYIPSMFHSRKTGTSTLKKHTEAQKKDVGPPCQHNSQKEMALRIFAADDIHGHAKSCLIDTDDSCGG